MKDVLSNIYDDYFDVVDVYIHKYEVLANKFPIGILNELRAIFTHIGRAYKSNELDEITMSKELEKAKDHMSRAKRDCYKYYCMAVENKYIQFIEILNSQNLRVHEIKDIYNKHSLAVDYLFQAKEYENITREKRDEGKLFSYYQKAQVAYEEIYDKIKQII